MAGLGLALALLGAVPLALAHDSWLAPLTPAAALAAARQAKLPALPAGQRILALGTGNQFPKQETAIAPEYLVRQGCRSTGSSASSSSSAASAGASAATTPQQAMAIAGLIDNALLMAVPGAGATSCWVQSSEFKVELTNALVPVYMDEVRPGPQVLAAWAAMQAQGLPWRERYVKHARIELAEVTSPTTNATPSATPSLTTKPSTGPTTGATPNPSAGPALPQPSPLALDLVLQDDVNRLGTVSPVTVQLLRDGQPLAGLSVELRNEQLALGIWLRSDEQGLVRSRLPLPGRWLFRAIDLRPVGAPVDGFESRFVTLALTVPAQRPSSLISSTRSASQTMASKTITSEPAVNTPQR